MFSLIEEGREHANRIGKIKKMKNEREECYDLMIRCRPSARNHRSKPIVAPKTHTILIKGHNWIKSSDQRCFRKYMHCSP